jgi:hypothetical protein
VPTYTTSTQVIDYSGLQPEWLDKTEDETKELVDRWIDQAEELVNRYCRTEWTTANVPEGVKSATERIVANMVAQARLNRRAGVIRTDQYGQREETPMPSTRIFTQAIKDDLNLYIEDQISHSEGASSGTIALRGSMARALPEYPQFFGDWEHMKGQYPYLSPENQGSFQ